MNKELLLTFENKVIKVDRGGPESREGVLLSVGDDYFTVLTKEDGIIFYKTEHIKSITQDSKNNLLANVEMPKDFKFVTGHDFKSILDKLCHSWVKVNRGGPESIEGVLEIVKDDYVMVVSNEKVVWIAMLHIRNISYGHKLKKEEQNH